MVSNVEYQGSFVPELLEILKQLDQLLQTAVSNFQTTADMESRLNPYRGLYINQEDVEHNLMQEPGTSPLYVQQVDLEVFLADVVANSATLSRLQQTFALSLFDVALIIIAVAPEIDLRYERIYAYLQDDVTRKRPTVDLALNLLCTSPLEKIARRVHFATDAPLLCQGLLHLIPDPNQNQPPLLAQYLKLDEQVTRLLLGEQGLDPRLSGLCQLHQPKYLLEQLPLSIEIKQALAKITEQAGKTQKPLHLYFYGSQGVGKQRTAEAIAHHLNVFLITADLLELVNSPADWETTLKLLFREAQCRHAIIYLAKFDELITKEPKAIVPHLFAALAQHQGITILAGRQPWQPSMTGNLNVFPVKFTTPNFAQRRTIWETNLTALGIQLTGDELDALSDRFRLTLTQIERAIATAHNQSLWEEVPPTINHFFAAARIHSGQDLTALARKITPKYTWNDIILPPDPLTQLQEICYQAQYRSVVYGQWGFERKLSLGKGLNVLFSGSPGTGKTMAAEVIAHELQIELYKIDLSQVVSKYIGETEKNLDRIFTAAQSANAILFFDEADALFGKRSQVKDAHDRYANIEVGYLLQKMEEYEGVAILATNLRDNMDEAFVRRIQVIIEFPFPDEEYRQQIWQVVFPHEAPLGEDVDFGFLAKEIRLAGGNIKNIGLAAAFYAASDSSAISMSHLLKAAAREHQKLGRTWQVSKV
ncbi:MAG: ATP-binding protein [Goleter apudmare HA4340-LM2]|jgi:AAA+ superfamily predicted ATPase|nr:ATP-binding protein [Goleter apudmare HA4340-LM2]